MTVEQGKVPRLSDLADAAAYLSISRSAVRHLVNGGHLARVQLPSIGRSLGRLDRFLLDKADLDAIVERSKLAKKVSKRCAAKAEDIYLPDPMESPEEHIAPLITSLSSFQSILAMRLMTLPASAEPQESGADYHSFLGRLHRTRFWRRRLSPKKPGTTRAIRNSNAFARIRSPGKKSSWLIGFESRRRGRN